MQGTCRPLKANLRIWFASGGCNAVTGSVLAVLVEACVRNTAWGELSNVLFGLKCLRSYIYTLTEKSMALFSL